MSRHLVIVDQLGDWNAYLSPDLLLSARQYIASGAGQSQHGTIKAINLSRSYRYLGVGYYVSLLAEARGHRVIPSVRTMLDLSRKTIYQLETEALDEDLGRQLKRRAEDRIDFSLYFGRCQMQNCQIVAGDSPVSRLPPAFAEIVA